MAKKIFFITFIAYLVSWLFAEGAFSYKLLVLGRELLVLAVVPLVISLFRKKLWAFMAMALLAIAAFIASKLEGCRLYLSPGTNNFLQASYKSGAATMSWALALIRSGISSQ